MPSIPITDHLEVLRVLTGHRVKFVLVGGLSAVIQGTAMMTFDVDIVHSRDPDNILRLLRALESLEAYYRTHPGRMIKPNASHLSSLGHQLLMTRAGPLDILGMIGRGREYDDLLRHTVEMEIGEGVKVAALDLETLILTKEEAGAEKDQAALPLLRRTLEEKKRR